MAVPTGIEPAIPRVTGECDNRYTTEPYFWLQEKDLNLRPLGYEPNELPLLYPAMFSTAKLATFHILHKKFNLY